MDQNSQFPQSQPQPHPDVPAGQNPLDYLNSISAQPRATTMNPVKLWAFIGGGLLLVVAIFFMLMNFTKGSTPTDKFVVYQYRLTQVTSTAKTNAKLIKNSDLRALSSSMNTILVGALAESNQQLGYFDLKKSVDPPQTAAVVKEFSALTTKLDNANLNNNFDQVYAREMAYQVAALVADITTLEKATSSSSVRTSLETSRKNIAPYINQYNDYNNSQS